MKNIIVILFSIFFVSSSSFAQDLYERYPEKIAQIREVLKNNTTDQILYVSRLFYCHQFASKLFLEESSLTTNTLEENVSDLEQEWKQKIQKPSRALEGLYYVALSSPEDGFYHAINAVLLDESAPEKLESYIFIEPQSDALILPEKIRQTYHLKSQLQINIGTFDSFKFNGSIWQSFTSNIFTDYLYDESDLLKSSQMSLEINSDNRIQTQKARTESEITSSSSSKVVYY